MSHKWKWCVIDCTGHAIKGMNRRAVVHRAEADKALAEAEARLAAAEQKLKRCLELLAPDDELQALLRKLGRIK